MKELEEEIQNPTGVSTVIPPKLSVNGVLVSKECGLLYAITDSEGLRFVLKSIFLDAEMNEFVQFIRFLPQSHYM